MKNWAQNIKDKFTSGVSHAFILHGNTQDYATPNSTVRLRGYLAAMLSNRDIVVVYNLAEGITFPFPDHKKKFLEVIGAKQPLTNLAKSDIELPKDPGQALALIEQMLKSPVSSAAILEHAESIVPAAELDRMSPYDRVILVTLQRWGMNQDIIRAGNLVIMVTQCLSDIHVNVRMSSSKWEAIQIPLPGYEERLEFVRYYSKLGTLELGLSPEQIAMSTAGLSLIHIEDIFLRAAQEVPDKSMWWQFIKERKEEIIANEYSEVLEIIDPNVTFDDIGGLSHVKEFFYRSVIRPIREGRKNRVPMGVLMTGPAGTGKSVVALAVAKESGINFVRLNPAKLLGQYVGSSERLLEKALSGIEALAPCGVFIDEIDQAYSRGASGDSGVSMRQFKRMLEFMSDTRHRGRIIFIAATNRPDLLDPALKRAGRFDKKVPCLAPTALEREEIIKVMARRYGLTDTLSISPTIINKTEGYTGAEVETLIIKALELVEDKGLEASQALELAVELIRPSTADIEFMTAIALQECNDKELLPPAYRDKLDDRISLEGEIIKMEKARGKRTF